MSRVMEPLGNVETFAWEALPSFIMLPLPKLLSISPSTRSRAFFLASLFAAVCTSADDAFVAVAAAAGLGAGASLETGFADAFFAAGFAFAADAELDENEALCLDCASKRDAREPPPVLDSEPLGPFVSSTAALVTAESLDLLPKPEAAAAGGTAWKRRWEEAEAAGRAILRPYLRSMERDKRGGGVSEIDSGRLATRRTRDVGKLTRICAKRRRVILTNVSDLLHVARTFARPPTQNPPVKETDDILDNCAEPNLHARCMSARGGVLRGESATQEEEGNTGVWAWGRL